MRAQCNECLRHKSPNARSVPMARTTVTGFRVRSTYSHCCMAPRGSSRNTPAAEAESKSQTAVGVKSRAITPPLSHVTLRQGAQEMGTVIWVLLMRSPPFHIWGSLLRYSRASQSGVLAVRNRRTRHVLIPPADTVPSSSRRLLFHPHCALGSLKGPSILCAWSMLSRQTPKSLHHD
ncbi:hypothetical protein BD413DRAFT_163409 [Trametes elegans]|nr:hypothetical protein BD413DRAFT_163409 [Trametes elegans]